MTSVCENNANHPRDHIVRSSLFRHGNQSRAVSVAAADKRAQ